MAIWVWHLVSRPGVHGHPPPRIGVVAGINRATAGAVGLVVNQLAIGPDTRHIVNFHLRQKEVQIHFVGVGGLAHTTTAFAALLRGGGNFALFAGPDQLTGHAHGALQVRYGRTIRTAGDGQVLQPWA